MLWFSCQVDKQLQSIYHTVRYYYDTVIASVQVGIKTFEQTGALTASCVDAEGNTLATGDLQISTHTDMYYSLTNLSGASCLQWQDSGTGYYGVPYRRFRSCKLY